MYIQTSESTTCFPLRLDTLLQHWQAHRSTCESQPQANTVVAQVLNSSDEFATLKIPAQHTETQVIRAQFKKLSLQVTPNTVHISLLLCLPFTASMSALHCFYVCLSLPLSLSLCVVTDSGEPPHQPLPLTVSPFQLSPTLTISFSCSYELSLSGISWNGEYRSSTMPLYTHTITHSHTPTHSLSLVLVVMIKPKELKTKISHTHSLILAHRELPSPITCGQVHPDRSTHPRAGEAFRKLFDATEKLVNHQEEILR